MNYESKHNMNYWENNNYLGVGLAAAGYLETIDTKILIFLKNTIKI